MFLKSNGKRSRHQEVQWLYFHSFEDQSRIFASANRIFIASGNSLSLFHTKPSLETTICYNELDQWNRLQWSLIETEMYPKKLHPKILFAIAGCYIVQGWGLLKLRSLISP